MKGPSWVHAVSVIFVSFFRNSPSKDVSSLTCGYSKPVLLDAVHSHFQRPLLSMLKYVE